MSYKSGEKVLGKYRIESLLGKGAFAEVYRAIHLELNTHRAIKILRKDAPGLGSTEYGDYQNRFQLEAQLGAKLDHPNIIRVHDFERDGKNLILVMEYAAGGSLTKRIEEARQSGLPMPLETAISIALEVADGLSALHAMDVVHRDLKPSNILFDGKGHAKVADLGLAQVPGGPSMRSQLSNPAPHPGTPAYMSPEQEYLGRYLTPASDVYSLGLVLFEMLTGRVYRSQRPGTRVGSLRGDIPAWVDDLLASMLSETMDKRPWNGKELAGLLHTGLQKEEELQKSTQALQDAAERARQAELDKALRANARQQELEEQKRAAEIARLSEAVQVAIQRGDWSRAKQAVEELAKVNELGQMEAAKLQERIAQAQREQDDKIRREKEQRSKEIARLTQETESALTRKDWERAKGLIRQLEQFGAEGQATASRLRKNIPNWWKAIPGWVKLSVVGGLVVTSLFIVGLAYVIGQIGGAPTPAVSDVTTDASPATEAPAPTEAPSATEPPVALVNPDLVTPEPILPLSSWTSFTTPHPILSDWRVRRAIAYCTNRADLINSVYPLLTDEEAQSLVMDSFIPKWHWAYAGENNLFIYSYDPTKGKSLLEEAGWNLSAGSTYRVNGNGDELALTFTTTTASFRQTWAAVWEAQMADCGIHITRNHVAASWWFGDTSGITVRDYELGAFAWVAMVNPGGQTLYACDQIPFLDNNWSGQNSMGWCNEAASTNIKLANHTLNKDEQVAAYTIAQTEFTKDVPSLALFNRISAFAYNANLQGVDLKPGNDYYLWNINQWEIPGKDTIVIGISSSYEPSSLFYFMDDLYIGEFIRGMIYGMYSITPNLTPEPILLKKIPSIENGLAEITEVNVGNGDKVVDTNGTIIDLQPGNWLVDANGNELEFTGGTVTMSQLKVRYEFVSGLSWSDRTPVTQADFELYYRIACDPETGNADMGWQIRWYCEKVQKIEFFSNGYTVTWLPSNIVINPDLFIAPFGVFPSEQTTSDGRLLQDVPARDWGNLWEVNERPLGTGPYIVSDWIKGVSITLTSNSNYIKGAPKTSTIIVKFISDENIVSALLNGEIDFIGSESLSGVDETLRAAETAGKIKILVLPGGTWEHIDINLFIP